MRAADYSTHRDVADRDEPVPNERSNKPFAHAAVLLGAPSDLLLRASSLLSLSAAPRSEGQGGASARTPFAAKGDAMNTCLRSLVREIEAGVYRLPGSRRRRLADSAHRLRSGSLERVATQH